jgi:predicted Fe-S protein YdhL (DUF1289 family)
MIMWTRDIAAEQQAVLSKIAARKKLAKVRAAREAKSKHQEKD